MTKGPAPKLETGPISNAIWPDGFDGRDAPHRCSTDRSKDYPPIGGSF